MSTSILNHGFSLRGYRQLRVQFTRGQLIFTVQDSKRLCCASCSSPDVISRGSVTRRFKTLPIGNKPCFLLFAIPRVECKACGAVRRIKVRFADPKQHHTRTFERLVLELSSSMTIRDIARFLGVSWDLVKAIQKRALKKRFDRPKLSGLRRFAVDEIYCGKKRKYLTLVMDLDTGAVVFIGDGKGADALDPFWLRIRRIKNKIKAVAMDMSAAFYGAVQENLPKAKIVFDHFHIVKLMNEKLTEIRRDVQREATSLLKKKVLKGTRWLLLKNPENLSQEKKELKRLNDALRLNKPLATAYYMKEDLRQFWSQESKEVAEQVLNDWIARAEKSGVKGLKTMAKTLQKYRRGLLAYYDEPISTGPLEGTNAKIRVLQRKAYGFRDFDFFKLRIKALHVKMQHLFGSAATN